MKAQKAKEVNLKPKSFRFKEPKTSFPINNYLDEVIEDFSMKLNSKTMQHEIKTTLPNGTEIYTQGSNLFSIMEEHKKEIIDKMLDSLAKSFNSKDKDDLDEIDI